jgi:hypothetical protein
VAHTALVDRPLAYLGNGREGKILMGRQSAKRLVSNAPSPAGALLLLKRAFEMMSTQAGQRNNFKTLLDSHNFHL